MSFNIPFGSTEQYAYHTFRPILESEGFAYKKCLWYKLIRDEVFLVIGFHYEFASYEMYCGILPTFLPITMQDIKHRASYLPFIQDASCLACKTKKPLERAITTAFPLTNAFNELLGHKKDIIAEGEEKAKTILSDTVLPVFRKIQNVRDAFREILWIRFLMQIDEKDYLSKDLTADWRERKMMKLAYCFFHMYDQAQNELQRTVDFLIIGQLRQMFFEKLGYKKEDYVKADKMAMEAFSKMREDEREEWAHKICPNDYSEIERLKKADDELFVLHLKENHQKTMRTLKRQFNLVPTGNNTLWQESNRLPFDIGLVLVSRGASEVPGGRFS